VQRGNKFIAPVTSLLPGSPPLKPLARVVGWRRYGFPCSARLLEMESLNVILGGGGGGGGGGGVVLLLVRLSGRLARSSPFRAAILLRFWGVECLSLRFAEADAVCCARFRNTTRRASW